MLARVEKLSASLLAQGIEPHDVANLLVVREAGQALGKAKGSKVIAVPPSMCGLFGIDAVGRCGSELVRRRGGGSGGGGAANAAAWTHVGQQASSADDGTEGS